MYYPIQIPCILDEQFSEAIDYSEKVIDALSEFVICFWQMKSRTAQPSDILEATEYYN